MLDHRKLARVRKKLAVMLRNYGRRWERAPNTFYLTPRLYNEVVEFAEMLSHDTGRANFVKASNSVMGMKIKVEHNRKRSSCCWEYRT